MPQGAGSGQQRPAGDHFDPHAEVGTKEEKRARSRLNGAWKAMETPSSWSKALGTLARAVGLEELGVAKPREHLAKVVRQDNHREDHRRTPQEAIARTRKQVGIPKGTQQARKLLQGEVDPEVQPPATTDQAGFSPRRGGGRLRGEGSPGRPFWEGPGPEDGSLRSGGERQRGQPGQAPLPSGARPAPPQGKKGRTRKLGTNLRSITCGPGG